MCFFYKLLHYIMFDVILLNSTKCHIVAFGAPWLFYNHPNPDYPKKVFPLWA